MDMMTFTNYLLLGLCVFTMLLVWSRNWKRKQAYYEKIKSNPDNIRWVKQNLSGVDWRDLKTVSERFQLPLLQAKQLIDYCKTQNRP
ncbi:hypothetical protein [Neisseria animalis]|uniref:Uncharacterized protein n=1 Tax=Neisseria animalis TaxID=492 RepID=A0A5P3MNL5_NEIAN|nr:hypothetical protein [Neisseria animalis]QEY23133.1 hypothetical protein D0T90_00270 [Neisseria animalis]ROW32464.1 hypothetical protein CGZ60_04970 [Neisseria animalis]VEE08208.1 Uncharacterised protein [Neisseria animalis]